jgi:quinol monooxygenase YgiN
MTRTALLSLALLGATLPVGVRAQEENPLVAQVRAAVSDPSKPFVMLIRIEAKPGMGKQLEAAFAPAIAATRKEKGCLAYDLGRSAKSPDAYVLYERWASLDDLKAHLAAKHIAELLPKLGELSAAPAALDLYLPAAE